MRPGETYVTVLPGHSRPAFVRRRRSHGRSTFAMTALARTLGGLPRRRRSYSVERTVYVGFAPSTTHVDTLPPLPLDYPSRSRVLTQESIYSYPGPSRHSTRVLEQQARPDLYTTRVIMRDDRNEHVALQHTCHSCGRYRSSSYHSRHPLAVGEIPGRSVCRRCLMQHTSSEESVEGLRAYSRVSSLRRSRRDFSQHTDSYRYVVESSGTSSTSSASKEDIRIIRRTRSVSRDGRRVRSSSSSRYQPRVQVTIQPRLVESRSKSFSAEPTELVERTRCARQRDHFQSRSGSLGSGLWTDSSIDETLPVRPRSREYDEAGRYTISKSYQPRKFRHVSYGYDGDYTDESESQSSVVRRRSESVLAKHESHHESRKNARVTCHVRGDTSRDTVHRGPVEMSSDNRPYIEANSQSPLSAVRRVHVEYDDKFANEHRGQEIRTTGQRRVAFTKGSPRRQRSSSRHIVEADDLRESQRLREEQELVIDSGDDRPQPCKYVCT